MIQLKTTVSNPNYVYIYIRIRLQHWLRIRNEELLLEQAQQGFLLLMTARAERTHSPPINAKISTHQAVAITARFRESATVQSYRSGTAASRCQLRLRRWRDEGARGRSWNAGNLHVHIVRLVVNNQSLSLRQSRNVTYTHHVTWTLLVPKEIVCMRAYPHDVALFPLCSVVGGHNRMGRSVEI